MVTAARRGHRARRDTAHRGAATCAALLGTLWGAASSLPLCYPHGYFQALGYGAARAVRWLLPSWYATRVLAGLRPAIEAWPNVLVVALHLLASAAIGCVLGLATAWAHAQVARRPPNDDVRPEG